MNVAIRRFALPLAAVVVLWIAAVITLGTLGELVFGSWEVGRLYPFSNSHLLEEASEGLYAPLSDPLFVLFSLAVAISAFGLSMFWGALKVPRSQLWLVWLAALTGIGLLAVHLRSAFSSEAPASILAGALFVLAACFGASCAGVWLSVRDPSKVR
jgi:FtsH-binding integral membrane protein